MSKFRYSNTGLETSLYTGRKSLATPPRLSYTQRVRQIYRSPNLRKTGVELGGYTTKRSTLYSPLNDTYSRRKANLLTAEVTPESMNYKLQKQEILKGLKDTFSK